MFKNRKFNDWVQAILLLVIFLAFSVPCCQASPITAERGISVSAVVPAQLVPPPAATPSVIEEEKVPLSASITSFWTLNWKIGLGIFVGILAMIIFFVKTKKRWKLAFLALFKGVNKIEAQ